MVTTSSRWKRKDLVAATLVSLWAKQMSGLVGYANPMDEMFQYKAERFTLRNRPGTLAKSATKGQEGSRHSIWKGIFP